MLTPNGWPFLSPAFADFTAEIFSAIGKGEGGDKAHPAGIDDGRDVRRVRQPNQTPAENGVPDAEEIGDPSTKKRRAHRSQSPARHPLFGQLIVRRGSTHAQPNVLFLRDFAHD
jgi:hypothetical protein